MTKDFFRLDSTYYVRRLSLSDYNFYCLLITFSVMHLSSSTGNHHYHHHSPPLHKPWSSRVSSSSGTFWHFLRFIFCCQSIPFVISSIKVGERESSRRKKMMVSRNWFSIVVHRILVDN